MTYLLGRNLAHIASNFSKAVHKVVHKVMFENFTLIQQRFNSTTLTVLDYLHVFKTALSQGNLKKHLKAIRDFLIGPFQEN